MLIEFHFGFLFLARSRSFSSSLSCWLFFNFIATTHCHSFAHTSTHTETFRQCASLNINNFIAESTVNSILSWLMNIVGGRNKHLMLAHTADTTTWEWMWNNCHDLHTSAETKRLKWKTDCRVRCYCFHARTQSHRKTDARSSNVAYVMVVVWVWCRASERYVVFNNYTQCRERERRRWSCTEV